MTAVLGVSSGSLRFRQNGRDALREHLDTFCNVYNTISINSIHHDFAWKVTRLLGKARTLSESCLTSVPVGEQHR